MNSTPDPDANLKSLVDGGLKGLPPLRAPRTLIPNVIALLEVRARQWWERAWWHWPIAAQGTFLLLALALVALASRGSWILSDGLDKGACMLSERLSFVADLGQRLAPLTEAGMGLAERFGASLLFYAAIAGLFAYLACLGTGTALVHIVWKRD